MIVYHFPEQALHERTFFSIAGCDYATQQPAGELGFVPSGAEHTVPDEFDGQIFHLPLSQQPQCISTQLSGGTLRQHLHDGLTGCDAPLVLCAPYHHRFSLPCPDGLGQALRMQELDTLCRGQPVFFSECFCCQCCILPDASAPQLILFDTPQTMAAKLDIAASCGAAQILCMP